MTRRIVVAVLGLFLLSVILINGVSAHHSYQLTVQQLRAGLTIDDQMVIKLGSNLPMPSLNVPELNIHIGSGNESCGMFFRRSDIDQDETLLWHRRRLGQSGTQLLDREQVGMMG